MARKHQNYTELLKSKHVYYTCFALTTIVFVVTRLFRLDSVPFSKTGMMRDEVSAAYDAWCIQGWGCDRDFVRFPFYFANSGQGQSPMNTYLAAIIFRVFGFSVFNYRLVGVICAIAAYICLFLLSRKVFGSDNVQSLVPNFLMTVFPFFLTSEHWGLDCYLFLSFSIMMMFFMTKAVEDKKTSSWILYGVVIGAVLYTYGISYIVIPPYFVIAIIYFLYTQRINVKQGVIVTIVFTMLAMPLAIQQMVNMSLLPPFSFMKSDFFCLSRRLDEIDLTLSGIPQRFLYTLTDLFIWRENNPGAGTGFFSMEEFGTIFYFSIPFVVVGFILAIVRTIDSLQKQVYEHYVLILLLFILEFIVALMTGAGYRVNGIYYSLLMFTALGIEYVCENTRQWVWFPIIIGVYCIFFLFFSRWMYSYGQNSWTESGKPENTNFQVTDIHTALAAKEVKDKYKDKFIQMIVNDQGEDWWKAVCLFYGISPYEYHRYMDIKDNEKAFQNYVGDGYAVGIPEELDLSGNTVYLIQDELHHITSYLVSEGFTNEIVSEGGYSIVVKQ